MGFTGATPPNPPNYTKLTYADWLDNTKFDTSPPPYYDDGAAGSVYTFATNIAALASGTGATSGGTENTYPGASAGAVPASTSVAHEGAGTETSSTATGNVTYSYPGGGTLDTGKAVGCGPVQTAATILAGPNANHATTLTATGTGFNRQSVIWSNGIAYPTTFVSATSLTCTAPKKATAGTLPVKVVTGGAIETATVNWTFT
jgi:hypothetical protein